MRKKTITILAAWAAIISSIILQALYSSPMLTWFHYLSLFLISTLSGILIADLKEIILGYFIVVLLSVLIIICCLAILPSITGKVLPSLVDLLVQSAIVLVMRSTFPSVWILCLLAVILGSAIAEYFKITDVP